AAPASEASDPTAGVPKTSSTPLICLWQHEPEVDIAPLVKDLGFNTVWTDDPQYTGQRWEDTQMYRALQVPGVKYVIPKIERAAWGWTHEESLVSARWIADLSLKHKEIIGLYLNDFYDEIEDGHRTMEQWREIIAAAKSVNPNLDLWVPHYPHRGNEKRAYDIDYQGVIFNIWDPRNLDAADRHLATAEAQHAGKIILGGLYINSGSRHAHWLTEEQFKNVLKLYVEHVNAGKLNGLRIYCACQFVERPEYNRWAKEVMKDLKRPQ
ncbi:MAG: hypothetical protein OEV33_05015, partial [Armatimonadota bacterium]|nr:hypothetical protein [Armatimonadota bacterium]